MPGVLMLDMRGVLMLQTYKESDLWLTDRFLDVRPMPGVYDWLPPVVEMFYGRVVINPKCDNIAEEQKKMKWFYRWDFFDGHLGLKEHNVVFCREKINKAEIARLYGVTHHVDNKSKVILPMAGVVRHRYLLCPSEKDLKKRGHLLEGVEIARSWHELHLKLSASAQSASAR